MKSSEELLAERTKRINDAIALRVPDRVPILFHQGLFPARYAGITYQEAFYDLDKWLAVHEKTITDFAPDAYYLPTVATPGLAFDALGYKQWKWPGHDIGPNTPHQFVEGEYMKAEEYDAFLDDPTDFLIRTYLPRTHVALEGLGMLPPLKNLVMGAAGMAPMVLMPQIASALAALRQAGPEVARWRTAYNEFYAKMAQCGYPIFSIAVSLAPFDLLSDLMRGMRGAMLDMYRCPDKLIAAEQKLLPLSIGMAVGGAHMSGSPRVLIPLHRGSDGFMSPKQFEQFYWPGLKALLMAVIDASLTPFPYFEGAYDQRLEYLRELPKGKVVGCFERSDLFKVKETLGDVLCIAGDMPVSLLQSGTPEQIKAYAKKLIDGVGKDGGYIMTSNTTLDDANPELVKVWTDYTREYGVYR